MISIHAVQDQGFPDFGISVIRPQFLEEKNNDVTDSEARKLYLMGRLNYLPVITAAYARLKRQIYFSFEKPGVTLKK